MKYFLAFAGMIVSFAVSAQASEISANTTLPRGTILSASDITITTGDNENAETIRMAFVGKELTRPVYAGHKITSLHIREPLLVKRNEIVTMIYQYGGMKISTYGRALDEGSMGDIVELMNTSSRKKVHAVVVGPDTVKVQ
jgi:flagella basal body P-ring formation protein FlgA